MQFAMFIILAVTMPVVWLFRRVLRRRVQALMLRTSPKTAPAPPLSDEAQEVEATTTPRVVRLDIASIAPEADAARQAETLPARSLFRRLCLYDAVVVTGLFGLFYFYHPEPFIHWMAPSILILVSLRYALYAGQYKDQAIQSTTPHGWFRRWIAVAPEAMFRLLTHPRYWWYPLAVIALALTYWGSADWIGIWIACLLLIPAMLRVHIALRARKGANRRLLILRVFGQDKSTTLTFGAIRKFWQHIGSTFTVVDGSYIKYKYRSHSETHVAYVFFACLAWIFVFGTPELHAWWGIGAILSVLLVLAYAVGGVIAYLRAPQSFATSAAHIQEILQRFLRQPRRLDFAYKDLDMYCFDNTWKSALAAFVASADVVLMDLRGYSEKNKGCETEVNYLFDTTPINRIVFLINGKDDMQAVEQLVRTAWERLHATSPNLATADPVATVYDIKDERRDDVRGLINTLVARATLDPHVVRRIAPWRFVVTAWAGGVLLPLIALLMAIQVHRIRDIAGTVTISGNFPASLARIKIAGDVNREEIVPDAKTGWYSAQNLGVGHYKVSVTGPVCKSDKHEQKADISFFQLMVLRDFKLEGCSSLTIRIESGTAESIRRHHGGRVELKSEHGIVLAEDLDRAGQVKWSQLPKGTYTIILQNKPWKTIPIGVSEDLVEMYGAPAVSNPPGGVKPSGVKPGGGTPPPKPPVDVKPGLSLQIAQPPVPPPPPAGGQVQPASLITRVPPAYPPMAKKQRIEGVVRLTATIGTDGRLRNIQVVSGHILLKAAAVDAAKQWVYRPTLLNGQPVEAPTSIDVSFTLSR